MDKESTNKLKRNSYSQSKHIKYEYYEKKCLDGNEHQKNVIITF